MMIPSYIQKELTLWLSSIIQLDSKSRQRKEVLVSQAGFNSFNLFSYLDTLDNGYLSCSDLQRFIKPRLRVSNEEISHLMSHWDMNKEGRLDFLTFRRRICLEECEMTESEAIGYNIEYAFLKLVEIEIKGLRKIEKHRVKFINFKQFNLNDSFRFLDVLNQGFLSSEGVFAFLTEKRLKVSFDDAQAIMNRYDKDSDRKINFNEFSEAILPFNRNNQLQNARKFNANKRRKNCESVKHKRRENSDDIEQVRKKLSLMKDFSLPDAFCYFSKGEFISEKQLEKGLSKLGIQFQKEEISYLVKTFGSSMLIDYDQLCKILEPRTEKYSRVLSNRIPESIQGKSFSKETLRLYRKFFHLLLGTQKSDNSYITIPSVICHTENPSHVFI